jgi:histidinol-phosphatase (PHP family)
VFWTNYHSHCHFCDGKAEPEEYVRRALEKGVVAYGFSSHAPVPFSTKWTMLPERAGAYADEIRRLKASYREQIQLYCGLEIDYIPGIIGPGSEWVRNLPIPLDYTIGSVHIVGFLPDGTPAEIDGPHQLFLDGLHQLFGGDVERMVRHYYAQTRQMVREDCPDVIGHLDKIKMQSENNALFSEDSDWYRQEITQTLDVIAQSGAIVEVNTRGVYKKKTPDLYPGAWALEQMYARRIPVMLNSDAHLPDEITSVFTEAAEILSAIGYRELMVLWNGRWQPVPFSAAGISLEG